MSDDHRGSVPLPSHSGSTHPVTSTITQGGAAVPVAVVGQPDVRTVLAGTVTATTETMSALDGATPEEQSRLLIAWQTKTAAALSVITTGALPVTREKTCVECGAGYMPTRTDQIYCSDRCSARIRQRRLNERRRKAAVG